MEKKIKTNQASCPSCGATMRYSPEKSKLFCENCQTTKDINFKPITAKHAWENREKDTSKTKEWAEETKNLKCPNCGANVILNKLEYSKACPYCGSSLVGDISELPSIAPDGVLPFAFGKEEATERYVKGMRKKWFLPNKFKKAPPVDDIYGVYIPSFSYDAITRSKYDGTLATDHHHTDSKGRSYTTTSYQHIHGIHNSAYKDILVETSSKLNQAQFMSLEPYDMSKAVEFNQSFIMGYTVEHYENTLEECKKVAERIMEDRIKNEILLSYTYDRVDSFAMETDYTNQKYMYYLLPTYKCDYEYKNKKYTTFMNGQTGKVGSGHPKSPIKITLFVLMWVVLFIGILVLIASLAD